MANPGRFSARAKHRVIHYLQSERGLHAFAMRICHSKMDARIVARFVNRGVGGRTDLEFIGRLHEHQAMIRDRAGVASKLVGVEIERTRHVLGRGEREFGLAVPECPGRA